MGRSSQAGKVCAFAAILVASVNHSSWAQAGKGEPTTKPKLAIERAERASGVIVKVEPVAKLSKDAKQDQAHLVRLTINTNAIWSDWARDQVTANGNQTPRKAAEKGAKSVATKGEPETKDSLVVVALTPASKVETRFRTLTDEASKGAKTPGGARSENGDSPKSKNVPLPHFSASDLRPGLFVEIDYRRQEGADHASTVTVIRPVSDKGAPTESSKP